MFKQPVSGLALTLVLCLTWATPAHATNNAEEDNEEAMEILRQRVDQLEAEVKMLRRHLGRMHKTMRKVTQRLRKLRAQESTVVGKMTEIATTPKRILSKASRGADDTKKDTEHSVGESTSEQSSHQQDTTANTLPVPNDSVKDNQTLKSRPRHVERPYRAYGEDEAYEQYDRVLAWLDKDELTTFKIEMRDWLSQYGDSAHAPEALYWLAETHYIDGEWARSRHYYTQLIERFPQSEKIDDAKLKLAHIYQKEKKFAMARRLLTELKKSKDIAIRDLAKQRLEKLPDERP